MKNTLMLFFGFLALVIVACKKDKNENNTIELITSASWKIDTVGLDIDGNNKMDTELPEPLETCDKDDMLSFSADSTGIYSNGAIKCDEGDPDTAPFQWSLKANNVMNITGDLPDMLKGDVTIVTINESTLIISKELDLGGLYPDGIKIVAHFKK